MRFEKTNKCYVALGINLIGLCILIAILFQLPVVIWFALGFVVKWIALIVLTIVGIAIVVPALVYAFKGIVWAFVYTFLPEKDEPEYPPKWMFKKVWEAIAIFMLDIIDVTGGMIIIIPCLIIGILSVLIGLVCVSGFFLTIGIIACVIGFAGVSLI